MKALKNKPLPMVAESTKGCSKTSHLSGNVIKIKAITDADRQQLRISAYQYLLP